MNMIEKKMTTKEVAEICGVTEKTVRENAKTFGKTFENGKSTEWTEEELKKLQVVLMKNQMSQGTETNGGVVEYSLNTGVQVGLTFQEIVNSGNIEAMKELTTFAMNACAEVARNKQLVSENKLLLEQKQAAIEEVDRIYQVEHNFHNKSYSASQIAAELGVTPKKIGALANQHRLKIDPIYGKLCKIQLQNGKWVDQFMYNEEAKEVLANLIAEEV